VGVDEEKNAALSQMIRTFFALALCAAATALIWGQSLRFFAAWEQVCEGVGFGWDTPFWTLLAKARWNSGIFIASIAPCLPFLLFCGPRQRQIRQWVMMAGMVGMVTIVFAISGPPTAAPDVCGLKGPFPEIGTMLLALFIACPSAFLLAWLTRRRIPPSARP
jgi:hypothetical protein